MKIPKKLLRLSSADNGTLTERALKLCEEAGEVAEASLRLAGRKSNKGRKTEEMRLHVVEEAIDAIIMGMDILNHMNFTNPRKIKRLINQKLQKWQRSVTDDPEQNE